MNNHMKTVAAKAMKSATAILLAFFLTTAAQAQNNAAPSLEIRYAGVQGNHLLFDVTYSNESAEPFTLDVTDADAYSFYSEKFRDRRFSKRFAVDRTGLTNTIVFELQSAGGTNRQEFMVNGQVRMLGASVSSRR